jgi:WD40 repeat protein
MCEPILLDSSVDLVTSCEGFVVLWDSATRKEVAKMSSSERDHPIFNVAFSPDLSLLAAGSSENVRVWDIAKRACIAVLDVHLGEMVGVCFSPDGRMLLAGGVGSENISVWDVTTWTRCATLSGHKTGVYRLVFSPDGRVLATSSPDSTVRLWDLPSCACFAVLSGHSGDTFPLAFSPDGRTLASGGLDPFALLWDVQSRTIRARLENITCVLAIAYSRDGALIATGDNMHRVRLWDTQTNTLAATMEGHSDDVLAVSFSLDGRTLVSCAEDYTVRLWDVASRICVATMPTKERSCWAVFVPPPVLVREFPLHSFGPLISQKFLCVAMESDSAQDRNRSGSSGCRARSNARRMDRAASSL